MKSRTLAAALILLCAAGQALAQATPTPTPAPTPKAPKAGSSDAKKKYEALLERAKRGEGSVDYSVSRQLTTNE